jgi:hypothetical protein
MNFITPVSVRGAAYMDAYEGGITFDIKISSKYV